MRDIGLIDLHLGDIPHLFTQKKTQVTGIQDPTSTRNWDTVP